jgi:hypothetical protein
MTERIVERIGKRVNPNTQFWNQAKVKEIAHFLVRKIKEDTFALEKIESNEYKKLEVLVK